MSTKKKRSLMDITSVIGNVAEKHKKELKVQEAVKEVEDNHNDRTSEFKVTSVAGYSLESRVAKVPESFKIKPSLKKMVEEIVVESRSKGLKTSKGAVYNLLIENALKSF